jgi:hypothetical protein
MNTRKLRQALARAAGGFNSVWLHHPGERFAAEEVKDCRVRFDRLEIKMLATGQWRPLPAGSRLSNDFDLLAVVHNSGEVVLP